MPETVREYCLSLLEGGSLEDKLRPPVAADGERLSDEAPGTPIVLDAPRRDAAIALSQRTPRLPGLRELEGEQARSVCLERFAHHELCAVELFAWALLAFPSAPPAFRRGLLATLAEEQLHLRLYLERLWALGARFGERPLSDYLWQHIDRIAHSAHPLASFLCAMGLTFEQANLDYSLLYRDAFRAAGDEESARVMQRVHDDEVRHVRFAARWLASFDDDAADDAERYLRHVPFPLSATRAKARRFDVASRRRAGLSDALITLVRDARPSHQT